MAFNGKTDLEKAYLFWYPRYNLQKNDKDILPYLNKDLIAFEENHESWLEKSRLSLFLSAKTVADKLDVTQSIYSRFEKSELEGTITLTTLAKAAAAMDCELVYALRPKSKTTYSNCIWEKLLNESTNHPWLRSYDRNQPAKALASVANRLMTNPDFRKAQGWSQKANQKKEIQNQDSHFY
ncbi:MAG: helix-turn-helix domain-containing protein [Bdellovibrio sp.]|nr:helix-turn-helix domain-containing protein [Bdellovibrio sp.]